MLKVLIIIIVLFLACGYAIVLLRQLNSTAQQLGKLRQDLAKSDANLNDRLKTIQAKQETPLDAQSSTRTQAQDTDERT
jgi:predicted PurR-regulated permease PerM